MRGIKGSAPACRVEECTRQHYAKRLCRLHWERNWRTGSTDDPQPPSFADRFWARVLKGEPNECWLWKHGGYGVVRWPDGRQTNAHRVAYWLATGELPTVVRHDCDTPGCCNPRHLRAGTYRDNTRDMHERGRYGRSPLTFEKGAEIRALAAQGVKCHEIMQRYGIGQTAAYSAMKGKTWKR